MSQVLIQQYLNHLQDLRKVSGTHRESVAESLQRWRPIVDRPSEFRVDWRGIDQDAAGRDRE